MNYKNNNDNCVWRTLTFKVMLSVLLITQTGSRTRQHNYEFNGAWVNRTDVAWRHLPLAWQWKNLFSRLRSNRHIPCVHGLTSRSHDSSGGGDSSFRLCPGVRVVITRVALIGKSFEIDHAHLLTALSHSVSVVMSVLLTRFYIFRIKKRSYP